MVERCHRTASGTIHYWVSGKAAPDVPTLVFLPGLFPERKKEKSGTGEEPEKTE